MKDLNTMLLSTPKLWERENDIIQWGNDRNIIGNTAQGTFKGQQEKTRQEWKEWKEDQDTDSVGDIIVTLIMGLALKGTTLTQCVRDYYRDGEDLGWDYYTFPLEARVIWLNFFLDSAVTRYLEEEDYYEVNASDIVHCLHHLCRYNGWTLDECIQVAWDDIKDRKGLMCYGSFIKQSNIDALAKYGVGYQPEFQRFSGVVYSSEALEAVTNIFYTLGFTHHTNGQYDTGVFVETTGLVDKGEVK